MNWWQKLKKKVVNFFTGGNKQTTTKAPTVRNTGNTGNTVRTTAPVARTVQSGANAVADRRELLNLVKNKSEEQQKQTTSSKPFERFKTMWEKREDKTSPKALAGKNADKTKEELRNKLKQSESDLKSYHKATGHKYDVKGAKNAAERLERRQAQKSQAYDVKADIWTTKKHPVAMSAARGAASGASFGLTDLMAKGVKGDAKKGEAYYQAHKNKAAETAGEIAGSLASFGLTAGATEKAGTALARKVAPNAAERLAQSELIKKTATKATQKAVKKGLVKEASEDLIKQVGKDKAAKIVNALGTDIVQNLTTGAIYDINKASARHEVGSKEWWKELGESAAINFGVTGAIAGGSALTGGKRLAKEAAERLAKNDGVEEAVENAVKKASKEKGVVEFPPRDESAIEVINPNANKGKTVEIGAPEERIEVINPNAKKPRVEPEITEPKVEPEIVEPKVVEPETHNVVPEEIKAAEPNVEKQMTFDDLDGNEQMTLEDAMRMSETRKAQPQAEATPKAEKKAPPKSAKMKKAEEAAEREKIDRVMRKSEGKLDEEIRSQTEGEYGYRQGEHTAAEHSSLEHAKRMKEEQDKVYKQISENDVKELFEDDNSPFGVFKTANKTERQKVAAEATTRVRNDMYGSIHRLLDKNERLAKELTEKSALSSAEHITLDDIAEIIAIRNRYDAAGEALPKEYEEAFAHIIEWQRTESAQMLKAVDLFLKENSQEYRRLFIARDMDRYLRKVLGSDEVAIEDIKRSLEANHGAGYYDKMIDALSEFHGEVNDAAFRKAYADFQAEVFMNTKPTVWDTVNLWRHAFMLSSPKTGANNIIGNLMQRAMYNVSDAMTAVGERMAQGINKDVRRTTAVLKTADQRRLRNMFTSGKLGEHNLKNAKYLSGFDDQAFADAINRASDVDVADMMSSSKYMGEVIKGLNYKPTTAGGKVKQGLTKAGGFINEKYVSTMLNEPDSWFVERNYRSALLKYLEANGVNSAETLATKEGQQLLKDARAFAKDVALENTYKKANNVVSFLEGLRRKGHTKGSGLGYKAASIMLDAEVPYLKVPANLVINNFKYSPMGVFSSAVDAYKYVTTGDVAALNKATRDLSKSLTGTGMAALGYMMFCKDQMDDDSVGFVANAEDSLKEYGMRDNSFKIGNHTFNISNMGIGSVQFLMGAAFAEDLAKEGKTPSHQIALDALSKTVDTVADMSLMENAVSLLDAFGNGGNYDASVSERLGNAATEIAGDYAAQFIPNPLRGVAKGMTSADLDTGVKKGDTTKVQRMLERNKNNFIQGVPVLNEKVLPHKVDTHGNLVNERETAEDKARAVLNNTLNPFSTNTVKIPEADKEELKVTKENGDPYKPNGFDKDREFKAKVGQSTKTREEIDLTPKEREQVARAAKNSGQDMATALVNKGMFGDRLGERAQQILGSIPDDEEAARELLFSTPEWQGADNEQKRKWLDAMYGQDTGNVGKGVARTRNKEAYVNIAGNSEGDFRWQNDLTETYQTKYNEGGFADLGIDKGTYVDVIEACEDANHKWDEETQTNKDTINSAKKTKLGILSVEGLTPEQRVAIYDSIRGKRTGFGWNDWDGESVGGGRGYGRRRYRHGRRGGSGKTVKPKVSASKSQPMPTAKTAKASMPTSKTVKMPSIPKASSSSPSSSRSSSSSRASSVGTGGGSRGGAGVPSGRSVASSVGKSKGVSADFRTASVKSKTASASKKKSKKTKMPTPKIEPVKVTPPKVKFKKYEV